MLPVEDSFADETYNRDTGFLNAIVAKAWPTRRANERTLSILHAKYLGLPATHTNGTKNTLISCETRSWVLKKHDYSSNPLPGIRRLVVPLNRPQRSLAQ